MAFGYAFVDLTKEQKHARRVLLEYYPLIGQVSVLVIFALFQILFALSWFTKRTLGDGRPRSPSLDKRARSWTWLKTSRQRFGTFRWWMRKPLIANWGTRGEWIGGSIWTIWLLFLCFVQTGNDYMHLTKRFGIIGASQLPLHYLLAMRSPYSPVQLLTRMSHEELKAAHEVLGRIVLFLFTLHAIFYMNFFVISGFLAKRIKDTDVIFGLISIALFSILGTTALGQLRKWNYRVFYMSHVAIANVIIVTLFLHVTHIRPYIWQVLVVNALHLVLRFWSLKTYSGTVKLTPGTNLVQLRIPLNAGDAALDWKPGQHVYLSRPSGKSYTKSLAGQLAMTCQTNPFTIASLPAKDKELLLVARTLNGNTKHLAALARSLPTGGLDETPDVQLALEGPYGSSTRLPDISRYDRVLLVAGGVGATYILPIYRSIVGSDDVAQPGGPQIRLVWAVRKLAEASWAFDSLDHGEAEGLSASSPHSSVEVFVTRPSGLDLQAGDTGDEMEMAENEQLLSLEEQMQKPRKGIQLHMDRPNLSGIVDEVFSKSSRTAVFVCGPKKLSEQLSDVVEKWVRNGHDVYWHDETFGW